MTSSNERVAYDMSCHLLHGQHAGEDSRRMLQAIEGLEIVPLEDSDVCCGGAGIYNLLEPDLLGGDPGTKGRSNSVHPGPRLLLRRIPDVICR